MCLPRVCGLRRWLLSLLAVRSGLVSAGEADGMQAMFSSCKVHHTRRCHSTRVESVIGWPAGEYVACAPTFEKAGMARNGARDGCASLSDHIPLQAQTA